MTRDGGRGGLPGPLVEAIRDPLVGRQRLPYLLGLLEEDDVRSRLTASLAICLVVEHDPDLLESVARRLADRLDGDETVEVRHALDYLAARHPKRVDGVLSELADEDEDRARRVADRTGGGFARNDYPARAEGDRPAGRSSGAGESGSEDPRRVYSESGSDEAVSADDEPAVDPADDEEGAGGNGGAGAATGADGGGESEGDGGSGGGTGGSDGDDGSDGTGDPSPGRLSLVSRRLSPLVDGSRFEDIDVRSDRDRERYGDVYRAVGTLDSERVPLSLCLFHLPDGDRPGFVDDLAAALERWADVSDHPTVLTLYDWGREPRPWAALEYTGQSLAAREAFGVDGAVWNGLQLALGLSYAHQHGVVHGAIDPETVVYYGNALIESERETPMLAYPGLSTALRDYADPATAIAPGYAAPEHYDGSFGGVDHATDVYGLGAVLYRLCTGEPPYAGRPAEVRESVLDGPPPSAGDRSPQISPEIDRVLRKAMAARKIQRYETVTQLAGELRGIRGTDGA